MHLQLIPVDRHNFDECIKLSVTEPQSRWVASNLYSIAQAKVEPMAHPFCIYADGVMVGFTMFGPEHADPDYEDGMFMMIDRLMIDTRYQQRGYGKLAMAEILRRIREDFGFARAYISYGVDNEVARKLYAGFGFRETGKVIHGEAVARVDF